MKKLQWIMLAALMVIGVVSCEKEPKPTEQRPTIGISDVKLDDKTMSASAMVVPSTDATSWYWKVEKSGENKEYTKHSSASGARVEFDVEYDVEYTLSAYAENGAGRSDVATERILFPDGTVTNGATLTIGKPSFEEQTMVVTIDVTPSENTVKWGWSIEGSDLKGDYEGAEERSIEFTVEYDTEYNIDFYAENEKGEGEPESLTLYYRSPREIPFATIEMKNVTAFTMDAVITKHEECVRYVAGAVHSDAYSKERFVEQAQASLNPDSTYPFVIFNSATSSATFSEQTLAKNGMADSDENSGVILIPGVKYTIAVYAEGEDGYYEVYSVEQLIPEPVIEGNVALTLEVTEVTETSAAIKLTAAEQCKVLYGYVPYSLTSAENSYSFDAMSDAEIKASILDMVNAVPESYTEPINAVLSNLLDLNTKYMAYAIAIKDGKIGDVAYESFTTTTSTLTGSATITAASIAKQTSHEQLIVTLSTDDKADKVRLYAAPTTDHAAYADNLEYIMGASEYQNYREEFDVTDQRAVCTVNIYHPGDNYYIYAVAVDAEGEAGKMVCVAELAGYDTEYYTTIEEQIVTNKFTLDGTGEVVMSVTETENAIDNVNATISVTANSDNVAKIWLLRCGDNFVSDIESKVKAAFADDPMSPKGSVKLVEEGVEYAFDYMIPYDNAWGGTIIIAVVLDTDGKYNISQYYLAGVGVKNY